MYYVAIQFLKSIDGGQKEKKQNINRRRFPIASNIGRRTCIEIMWMIETILLAFSPDSWDGKV